MKKEYISPRLDAIKLLTPTLMNNQSVPLDDEGTDIMHSNRYDGPAGGFLWEDDNNVAE